MIASDHEGPFFESCGVMHSIRVYPNNARTEWVISVDSFEGKGIAHIIIKETDELIKFLGAGLGQWP